MESDKTSAFLSEPGIFSESPLQYSLYPCDELFNMPLCLHFCSRFSIEELTTTSSFGARYSQSQLIVSHANCSQSRLRSRTLKQCLLRTPNTSQVAISMSSSYLATIHDLPLAAGEQH